MQDWNGRQRLGGVGGLGDGEEDRRGKGGWGDEVAVESRRKGRRWGRQMGLSDYQIIRLEGCTVNETGKEDVFRPCGYVGLKGMDFIWMDGWKGGLDAMLWFLIMCSPVSWCCCRWGSGTYGYMAPEVRGGRGGHELFWKKRGKSRQPNEKTRIPSQTTNKRAAVW